MVAGTLLVFLPRPTPAEQPSTPSVPLMLNDVWPAANAFSYPDRLDDGTQFRPVLHLTTDISVGTVATIDGAAIRIMLRTPTGTSELRRRSKDVYPEFAGFTSTDNMLVWAETTFPPGEEPRTELWRLPWRTSRTPTLITADTGHAAFFDSQYDVRIVDNLVFWVSSEFIKVPATEVRSVQISGGKVTVRREAGTFALSAWPWLVTPYGGRSDPARLLNLTTGEQRTVPHNPGELTQCSPVWCRVGVIGAKTLARIDLVRPDGTDRRRMAGGDAVPIHNDVALLDRFEVLVMDGRAADWPHRARSSSCMTSMRTGQ